MESLSSAGPSASSQPPVTMKLLRDWQTSLGFTFADPEPGGKLKDPVKDEIGARRQFIGRLGPVFSLAFTYAYPDLHKIATSEIPGVIWEAPGVPAPVSAISDALKAGFARVFADHGKWVWKGRSGESMHPVFKAIDEMGSLRSLPSTPGVLEGEVPRPSSFGTGKIWNVHQVIPDVAKASGMCGEPELYEHVARRSRGTPVALAFVSSDVLKPLADSLEDKSGSWKPELWRMHALSGGYSLEMQPKAVELANRELRRRHEWRRPSFKGKEVVGCPVLHVSREGSSRKIIAELHDLIGILAAKYYRFLAGGV